MTPAKDAELRARYPLVFSRPLMNDEPIRCGDGWFDLLDRFCADIEALISFEPEAERPQYYAQQVKEKFGGLRFYLHRETHSMTALIRAVEDASEKICDVCGKPGEKRGGAPLPNPWWTRTRCNDHINWREGETGFAHKTEP